jgi:hypothetical protein
LAPNPATITFKEKVVNRSTLFIFTLVFGVLGLLLVPTGVGPTSIGSAAAQSLLPDQATAVESAVSWLINTHQNEDGGYTSFSGGAGLAPSDVGGTVDALLAISSSGHDAVAPLDFLRQNPGDVAAYAATDGSTAGKLLLAVTAAHQKPRDFAGLDLVDLLRQHEQPSGQFGVDNAFGQSLAILGLAAAGELIPETAVSWLLDLQAGDGSWDDGFGTAGNSDATAMAIMALVAAGGPDTEGMDAAVDFLAQAQLPDGGWEYGPGFGLSLNSTALVTQALAAIGVDIADADGAWAVDGRSPLDVLLDAQSESGAFHADFGDGPFDDFFTTIQAIPALAGQPFPVVIAETAAAADGPNQAALVVVLENGLMVERCVTFDEPQVSGFDLLQLSGLDLVVDVSGAGVAVCSIEGTGCPAEDCFCECSGTDCVYWGYWYQQDGDWQYAQVGAASYRVNPGDVQGWAWGPSSPTEATPPPNVTFDEVCSTGPTLAEAIVEEQPEGMAEETAVVETPEAAAETVPADTAVNWLPYALFGLLVLILGSGLLIARNK